MAEFGSSDRKRSEYLSETESDSRPTSLTSQSVDEEVIINEVGVATFAGAPLSEDELHLSLRKCHSLATTRLNLPADDRAVQIRQLHHIVHVSQFFVCSAWA